jgi:hypothetical protein
MIREFNGSVYAVAVDSKDDASKKPIVLNESARILWEALTENKTENELVELLLEEYEINRETAEKDVAEFLSVISKAGLLEQ